MPSILAVKNFNFPSLIHGEPDPQSLEFRVQKIAPNLRRIITAFFTDRDEIKNDRSLSPVGRGEAIRKAAEARLAEGEEIIATLDIENRLTSRNAELQNRVDKLFASDGEKSPTAFLQEREARDLLRDMSESNRLWAWNKAIDDGDLPTVQAVLNAPKIGKPLLDENTIREGKEIWARKRVPEVVNAMENLERTQMVSDETLMIFRKGFASELNALPRGESHSAPVAPMRERLAAQQTEDHQPKSTPTDPGAAKRSHDRAHKIREGAA